MQQFFDEIEDSKEDREYLERRERRRQRHLEERRRREKKLKMIKLTCGFILAGILITCVVGIGTNYTQNHSEKDENYIAQEQHLDEIDTTEVTTEVDMEEPVQPIAFLENDDTKGIYSESVISENAILIDADAGTVIAKKNAYEKMIPASMTKVLTLLVAADVVTEEKLDDAFTMTLEITDYAYKNDCSSVGFLDNEVVTVRDLLYGTILASGGDAAVGLATYVAGSHEAFVELMNEKVKQLGLSDSAHFTNSVGIYDKELYCTVYDMAVIMKAAIQNELCREVLKARTYTTTATAEHPEGITISNWFMRRIEDKDSGGEVMGAKTGYVRQSGNCAVSYQENANGTTYICVTGDSTSSWRCIYDHVEIYNNYVPE